MVFSLQGPLRGPAQAGAACLGGLVPRVWGRTWLKLAGHTVALMAGPDSLLHSLRLVYVGVEGGQLPPGTSPVLCVLQKPARSPPPLGMALPSHTAPGDGKCLWPQAWRTVPCTGPQETGAGTRGSQQEAVQSLGKRKRNRGLQPPSHKLQTGQ